MHEVAESLNGEANKAPKKPDCIERSALLQLNFSPSLDIRYISPW